MIETRLTKRICHKADDLLEMVADVQSYPEFINFLNSVRIKEKMSSPSGNEIFTAESIVRYKMISEKFLSRIEVDQAKKNVTVTKAGSGGPISDLQNYWYFYELSDGSTYVDFFIQIKLAAFPLEMLLKSKINKVAENMMTVFQKRANQKYPICGDHSEDFSAEIARLTQCIV